MKFCLLLLAPLLASAQNLKEFEKKVTEFTLANGLHFIILERHEAPVVSFNTYVKAGSLDDPAGQTGLAHMFEHMAFKGTPWIGSKNWPEEKKALAEVEEVYAKLEEERRKDLRAGRNKIETLEIQLKAAVDKANLYVESNAYPRIIEENGGVGLNAGTSLESTNYFYNFPSNRIELWFLLESQRFLSPVFREFYKEREVVMEERRMRVESNPQGKLMAQTIRALSHADVEGIQARFAALNPYHPADFAPRVHKAHEYIQKAPIRGRPLRFSHHLHRNSPCDRSECGRESGKTSPVQECLLA